MLAANLLSYGWAGLILALWFGLAVGSFLNVVIYRLPIMLERQWNADSRMQLELPADSQEEPFNLWQPRSRCPQCAAPIKALQNIPVVSWLMLRGRCASCRARIPVRYPLVELLTAAATLLVISVYGFTWLGLAAVICTWVLIAATFIDFDTQLLPDALTLPLLWLGLLTNAFGNGITTLQSAVIGAVAGYLFLWSTYWGFKLATGKEGMGYGDFKLLAAIGAWLGWQALPATMLLAAVLGLVYAAATFLVGARGRAQPIPFGPFLASAGWVCLLFRDTVLTFFMA